MVRQMSNAPDLEFLALQEALVGRYSLEREIGRGGMGIVYLAHEVRLDRPVALKLLPPELAAQSALRDRFLREARTAAKLSQPNIVPIYSVDEVEDFVFFVMMYVEGETLGERVRTRGPLPASEAMRILREIAWALAYAHGQGVVHRDVKPDNILIEAGSGRTLVMDFGIAQVSDSAGLTTTGEVLGTAEYMSPEQASGDAVDERSDLYSLGVLGHYMLSGQLPFQGATVAATLAKHLTQEAPSLAGVAPGLPRHLTQSIDRCLAKDPADRFADGEELADAMSAALAVRQEVPVAIRIFAEQNQKSLPVIATSILVAVWVTIVGFVFGIIGGDDFGATVFLTIVTLAAAAVPPLILTHAARRFRRSGYRYDDLIRELRGDIKLRREELASQHGPPTWIDRWARKLTYGAAALFLGGLTPIAFPFIPVWMANVTIFAIALPGGLALFGVGLAGALKHKMRTAVPGERWFRFWKSRVGRWLFKLAGVRLGRVQSGGAPYRPTEMAIGMAADQLYDDLPKDVRNSFKELPDVVRRLGQDAEMMRARVKELDGVLSNIESDDTLSQSGTAAAAPGVRDKRESLAAEVRVAREAAERRLSEAVAALETIRLELLRMHAGAGSVESMTADLTSALELSEDIERVLEGGREVEKLLGSD